MTAVKWIGKQAGKQAQRDSGRLTVVQAGKEKQVNYYDVFVYRRR